MIQLQRHPLSAAWPDMAHEDFDALVLSIENHGLREPITLYDGQILDGWHRYQACEAVGIDGEAVEFAGTVEEAEALVNDRHTRRSVTPAQRAVAVLKMYEWRTGSGGHNAKANRNVTVCSVQEIAEKAGVSKSTVEKVKAAVRADPDALEKIRTGQTTATKIVNEAKPAKPVAKPEAPPMVTAEVHGELVAAYNQLADRAKDLAIELESYSDVKDGDPAKALIHVRDVLRAVESRRDELMRECAEHVKTIKYWTRRAEKAEKALEEMKATAL